MGKEQENYSAGSVQSLKQSFAGTAQHSDVFTLVFSHTYQGINLTNIMVSSAGSMAVLGKKKDYVTDPVLVTNRSFTHIRFYLPFIKKTQTKQQKMPQNPINQPKTQIKK